MCVSLYIHINIHSAHTYIIKQTLFWMRLIATNIAPQHLFNFILSVSFFKTKDSLTEISDSLPPHYLFRSYIFSLYSNALLLRKCESRGLFGIISVSPWVCGRVEIFCCKVSDVNLVENSRMHTQPPLDNWNVSSLLALHIHAYLYLAPAWARNIIVS